MGSFLYALGLVFAIGGFLWIVVKAFGESILWGLWMLLSSLRGVDLLLHQLVRPQGAVSHPCGGNRDGLPLGGFLDHLGLTHPWRD
jgi:hypothetical protein